jgi:hypothetical protein
MAATAFLQNGSSPPPPTANGSGFQEDSIFYYKK